MRFIYVKSEADRQTLEEHGYKLLFYSTSQLMYCFENKHMDDMTFSLGVNGVFSDTLMY